MAQVSVNGQAIALDLPVQVPELTLKVRGVTATGVTADGKPLTQALTRAAFEDGTFYREGDATFIAFTPTGRKVQVVVT